MIDPDRPVGELGERRLLAYLRARIPAGDGVLIGVGDDAAAVEAGPGHTLLTTDSLVEGVHFLREWTPATLLGRKALSVNLSDIAAMAGVPRYATVSLALPRSLPGAYLEGLYDGLLERAAQAGVSIVGGNLSATDGPLVVDVTLIGRGDRLLRREGGQPGDRLIVSGTLGAPAEGLRLLRQGARLDVDGEVQALGPWTSSSQAALRHCLRAQLDPDPPLAFARSLAEGDWVHASLDISDGLSGDLLTLCEASGVAARVQAAALPVDPQALALERARGGDAQRLALHGGEEYQLLLAVPPDGVQALRDRAFVWNLALTDIGELHAGEPRVLLVGARGETELAPEAHDHFRAAR
jgi:thiamine-monophosphate kinase